jgi:hypothetical protein
VAASVGLQASLYVAQGLAPGKLRKGQDAKQVGAVERKALLRPLFSFGGWMTVSNIVSPMMVYMDPLVSGSFDLVLS